MTLVYAEDLAESSPSPTPETVQETITQPTPESTPEPTSEPTPEPTSEPTPEPTPVPTPEPSPEPTPEPDPISATISAQTIPEKTETTEAHTSQTETQTPAISLVTDNAATISSTVITSSISGNNILDSSQSTDLITGDALAIVNLLNSVNINQTNSQYQILFVNVNPEMTEDIDINYLWQKLINTPNSFETSTFDTSFLSAWLTANQNQLNMDTTIEAVAVSGNNQVTTNNDTAAVTTGNAAAIANAINLGNANLYNSKLLITVINILPNSTANVILPRPELFYSSTTSPLNFLNLVNTNIVDNNSDIEVVASSGGNNVLGHSTTIHTGDSFAISNNFSYFNVSLLNQMWFQWFMNIPDNSIYSETNIAADPTQEKCEPFGCTETVINNNIATVSSRLTVTADTGHNQLEGLSSSLKTGRAIAIANLLNFLNLNLINSNWLMGLTNIIGHWSGKIIYAYPDVTINLTSNHEEVRPGEKITATVQYQNLGLDVARQVELKINLPHGFSYISDSSDLAVNSKNQQLSWIVPDLNPGEIHQFILNLEANNNYATQSKTLFGISIPKVYAADIVTTVTIDGHISTADPDSNTFNNYSSINADIITGDNNSFISGDEVNNSQPILEIQATNNVSSFIYTGDTATFEVKLKNSGEGDSINTMIYQDIFNDKGQYITTVTFNVGRVTAFKSGTLRFGIVADKDIFSPGKYITRTEAFGQAVNGNEVMSNEVSTSFNIKTKNSGFIIKVPSAKALETTPSVGQILGNKCTDCGPNSIFPYVLLVFLSSLWFITKRHQSFTSSTPSKTILSLAAYAFVLSVLVLSMYQIGIYYEFVKPNDAINSALTKLQAALK